ncbi:hydroxyacid dehydrogenase [bacterium]|nr:hydroxyacid dehydrogenase [bacterium]
MGEKFRIGLTRDFLDDKGNLAYKDIGLKLLYDNPHVEVEFLKEYQPVATAEQIRDYDAVIVLKPHFTKDTFEGVERLTAIGRFGVGYDSIDVQACTDANVILFITPEGVKYSMAESVVTWLLMLSKRALIKDQLVRSERWDDRSDYMGTCLENRTLGLIGLGNIGREVVRLLAPFQMNIVTFDPYINEEQTLAIGVKSVSFYVLLQESDFVSINCPLNDETRGLIGERELHLMKSSAYLINTARGPIVNERAIIKALQENWIAGAALDVFEQEPINPDNPLLKLDNVILAPHAIGWTDEMFLGIGTWDCLGTLNVMRGEIPNSVVNRDVLDKQELQQKLQSYREQFGNTGSA